MNYLRFAPAAALALLLSNAALSQVPAQIDLDSVTPVSGTWSYLGAPTGSEAVFTDAMRARRLILRCNRAIRAVTVVRTGVPAAAPVMAIWTTSHSRSVPASFQATGELSATIGYRDVLLDAIAFSRGRFATGAAGAPLIAVPTSPEAARVIEDCRI